MGWRRAGGWATTLLALGAALIGPLVMASPSYAAAPVPVTVGITSPATLTPGAAHTVAFTVTNGTPGVGENTSLTATITIATSGGPTSPDFTFTAGAGCFNAGSVGNTCRFRFPENGAGAVRSLSFVVTAASTVTDVPAGGTTFDGSAISVSSTTLGSTPVSGRFSVTLDGSAAGPTGTPAATTIAGVVDNAATRQPLGGARVTLRDAAAHEYTTITDGTGRFSFTVTAAHPVAGPFVIAVAAAGYQQFTSAPQAFTPGTDITNLSEAVQPLAAASASARATASTTASTATTGTLSPPATTEPTGTNPAGTLAGQIGAGIGGAHAGSTSSPLDYILITGVVLIGVATVMLLYLLVRRRRDGDALEPVTGPPADDDTRDDMPEIAGWPPPAASHAPRTLPGPRHLAPTGAWQVADVRTLPPPSSAPAETRPVAATRVDDDLLDPEPALPTRPTGHRPRPPTGRSPSTRVRIYGADGYHGEPLDRNEGDRM